MGEFLTNAGVLSPNITRDPIRVDLGNPQKGNSRQELIGNPSHLMGIGQVNKTFRLQTFGAVIAGGIGLNRLGHEVV